LKILNVYTIVCFIAKIWGSCSMETEDLKFYLICLLKLKTVDSMLSLVIIFSNYVRNISYNTGEPGLKQLKICYIQQLIFKRL